MKAARGALIVLEGIDRTGKTSQAAKLVSALSDAGVKTVGKRFPDRTTATGKVINDYLQQTVDMDDHVIHLLYSANRWEARTEMLRLLNEGVTLVVDRYAFSGVAFSVAKGLDLEWCRAPDCGLPEPDAVIFLDISPAAAKERGGYGGERYEKEEFQTRVRAAYDRLKEPKWTIVDAGRTIEEVHVDLLKIASEVVKKVQGTQVGTLWT